MCRGRRDESTRHSVTIRQPRTAEATQPARTATAALAATEDIAATASRLTGDPSADRTAVVAAIRRRRRIARVRSEATTAAPDLMAAPATAVRVDTRAVALTEATGAKPNLIADQRRLAIRAAFLFPGSWLYTYPAAALQPTAFGYTAGFTSMGPHLKR